MKRQFIVPTSNLGVDIMVYSQLIGFDVKNCKPSLVGAKRFYLRKDLCSFYLEDQAATYKSQIQPYFEIVVNETDDYKRIIDEILCNSDFKSDYDTSSDILQSVTILKDGAKIIRVISLEGIL
jgi:hypothetical protein